jgi:hypothetical protein
VADGIAALDKVLATREFDGSDVIAVVHRTASEADGRSVGERLEALNQWYRPDNAPLLASRQTPRGIAVRVIKRSS